MSNKYEINKELVLSTGHITEQTSTDLEYHYKSDSKINLIVVSYEHGHRILTTDEGLKLCEGTPCELMPLIRLANRLECKWLVLDQDGPIMEDLKVFDW